MGESHSGKTHVIQQLIRELKERGRSVAAVKRCHEGFSLDMEGKGSWRFAQAGADPVALWSPDQVAVLQNAAQGVDASAIAGRHFPDVDIVLVEGGAGDKGLKKVEVLRKGVAEELRCPTEELIAVVADVDVTVDKPVYHPDQIGELADLLDRGFEHRESRVRVSLDGATVPLNPFVQGIFSNIISGMVASLRGVAEAPQHITLDVERKEAVDEGP